MNNSSKESANKKYSALKLSKSGSMIMLKASMSQELQEKHFLCLKYVKSSIHTNFSMIMLIRKRKDEKNQKIDLL